MILILETFCGVIDLDDNLPDYKEYLAIEVLVNKIFNKDCGKNYIINFELITDVIYDLIANEDIITYIDITNRTDSLADFIYDKIINEYI